MFILACAILRIETLLEFCFVRKPMGCSVLLRKLMVAPVRNIQVPKTMETDMEKTEVQESRNYTYKKAYTFWGSQLRAQVLLLIVTLEEVGQAQLWETAAVRFHLWLAHPICCSICHSGHQLPSKCPDQSSQHSGRHMQAYLLASVEHLRPRANVSPCYCSQRHTGLSLPVPLEAGEYDNAKESPHPANCTCCSAVRFLLPSARRQAC